MAISLVVDRVESRRWNWWLVIDDRKRIDGAVYNTQAEALAEAERFREQVAHAEVVDGLGRKISVPRRQAPPFKTTTGHKGAAKKAPARKAATKKTPARKAAAKNTAARKSAAKTPAKRAR